MLSSHMPHRSPATLRQVSQQSKSSDDRDGGSHSPRAAPTPGRSLSMRRGSTRRGTVISVPTSDASLGGSPADSGGDRTPAADGGVFSFAATPRSVSNASLDSLAPPASPASARSAARSVRLWSPNTPNPFVAGASAADGGVASGW